MFPTRYQEVLERMATIRPDAYGRTRNYVDGDVTRLSPYLSRGVISTRQVMDHLRARGLTWQQAEKFLQQLAWREYWQRVWRAKGELINQDLLGATPALRSLVPESIVNARTGIRVVDEGIRRLYETGYMHNHVRLYVASIACNIGRCHWRAPARWMYYHLLDGDWASNALSWQWVAGASRSSKYYVNQENINRYGYSDQRGTFLDAPYETLPDLPVPAVLSAGMSPLLETSMPGKGVIQFDRSKPTLIYNYYHLDPCWHEGMDANRVLLLEPSHFHRYPISAECVAFMRALAQNIPGVVTFVGEFDEFEKTYQPPVLFFREHPLNSHYRGREEPRAWMFDVDGYFPSFFSFWKACLRRKSY